MSIIDEVLKKYGVVEFTRLNDLYFPQGNEKGEYYEPYWKATIEDNNGYGATQELAVLHCLKKLQTIN